MKALLLILLLFSFGISGFSQSHTGDTWAQVKGKSSGTIALAYVDTYEFAYKDPSGKLSGICVDIMNDFVKYVNETKGVKLTTKIVGEGSNFKDMYGRVKGSIGGVFGMGNITITEERKREVKFSPPFITNIAFLISQTSVPTLDKIENISTGFNKLTGYASKGTLNEKRLQELKKKYFPEMKLMTTATSQETYEKVISDAGVFAYLDLAFYLQSVQQRKPLKRHPVGDVTGEQFGFIMPLNSDWYPLLEEFFKAKGGYTNSDSYKEILKRNLGETGLKLLQATSK